MTRTSSTSPSTNTINNIPALTHRTINGEASLTKGRFRRPHSRKIRGLASRGLFAVAGSGDIAYRYPLVRGRILAPRACAASRLVVAARMFCSTSCTELILRLWGPHMLNLRIKRNLTVVSEWSYRVSISRNGSRKIYTHVQRLTRNTQGIPLREDGMVRALETNTHR